MDIPSINLSLIHICGQTYTLTYNAENRLVAVSGAATASFSYDADGKQVIGTVRVFIALPLDPLPKCTMDV